MSDDRSGNFDENDAVKLDDTSGTPISPSIKKITIDEEAKAEEEFISDQEDTLENPLVLDAVPEDDSASNKEQQQQAEKAEDLLPGAIGSGNLEVEIPDEPVNNEQTLKEEKMNNDENPFLENGNTSGQPNEGEATPSQDSVDTTNNDVQQQPVADDAMMGEVSPENATTEVNNSQPAEEPAADTTTSNNVAATDNAVASQPVEPVVATTPDADKTTVTEAQPAKKKSKKGLIIAIIVAVVLIGGIIGAIFFINWHESAEKTVSDAIANAWNASQTQMKGTITLTPNSDSSSTSSLSTSSYKSMTIDYDTTSDNSNVVADTKISMQLDDDKTISFGVSAAYISGGELYFKLDLNDVKSQIKDAISSSASDSATDEEIALIGDMVDNVADKVNGQWYKVTTNDITSDTYKKSYDCLTEIADAMSKKENKDKIADIYKDNTFINYDKDVKVESKDGVKYYTVKANADAAKKFGEKVADLDFISKCKDVMSTSTSTETEESDLSKSTIKLGIKGWSHELTKVEITSDSDSAKSEATFTISYEKKSVSAPSDAKNVSEFMTDVNGAIQTSQSNYVKSEAKTYCSKYYTSTSDIDSCVEKLVKAYNEENSSSDSDAAIKSMIYGLV